MERRFFVRWFSLGMLLARWFGQAIIEGRDDLAGRIAAVSLGLSRVDQGAPPGLHQFLDEVELGELARLEMPDEPPASLEKVELLVADLIEVLRENELWPHPGESREATIPYGQSSGGIACPRFDPHVRTVSGIIGRRGELMSGMKW